jgi:hypothetical protein
MGGYDVGNTGVRTGIGWPLATDLASIGGLRGPHETALTRHWRRPPPA